MFPLCTHPAPGSPDDIREERHITPSDASFERTEARTTGDRPTVPSSADGVGHGVVGLASTVAGFHGGSSANTGYSHPDERMRIADCVVKPKDQTGNAPTTEPAILCSLRDVGLERLHAQIIEDAAAV
jgi:hypothetical protein